MKLSRVELLTHVADPKSVNTPKVSNFRTHRGEEATGYELEWDEGLVTITHGDNEVLVPMGNVAFMVPEPTADAIRSLFGMSVLEAEAAAGIGRGTRGAHEVSPVSDAVREAVPKGKGGWPKGKPRKAVAG